MRSTSTRRRRYVPRRRRSGSWSSSGLRPEGYPELVETSEMGREGSRCRARRGSGRPRRLLRPCAGDGRGGPADPSNAQLSTRRRYATKGLAIRRPGGGRAARPRPRWPEPRSRPADLQHATPAASGHHLRSQQCSNAGEHAGEPDTKGLQICDFGAILKSTRPHPADLDFPWGVAEWLKAAALKVAEPKGSVGSNPTPAAFQAGLGATQDLSCAARQKLRRLGDGPVTARLTFERCS